MPPSASLRHPFALGTGCLLAFAALPMHASAQCSPHWTPGIGDPGAVLPGTISDMVLWDPDGPGPLPARLAVCGQFTSVGGVPAINVAWMDLETGQWFPFGPGLGAGVTGTNVERLAVRPNGELIAGGYFTNAGALSVGYIAAWNGSAWTRLGTGPTNGTDGTVSALVTLPNGDVLVGGAFLSAGGIPAIRVARWNGSAWSTTNLGSLGGPPDRFTLAPNGDVLAVGEFRFVFNGASTVTANGIARWNGFGWSALGTGFSGTPVCVAPAPNGDIYAGGPVIAAGGSTALGIARWNGTAWSPLGAGLTPNSPNDYASANALLFLPSGELLVTGYFTHAGGPLASAIATWNGTTWSPLGAGLTGGTAGNHGDCLLLLPSGDVVVGGDFNAAGGQTAHHLARYSPGGSAPTVTTPTVPVDACLAGPDVATASASGPGPITYRWRLESPAGSGLFTDLAGATFDEPASGLHLDLSGADSPSLSITSIALGSHPPALRLALRASNPCGQTDGAPATLTLCPADFNCDGFLDFFDYLDFTTCFQSGVCGGSSGDFNGDGFVDFFDYLDFVDAFAVGC